MQFVAGLRSRRVRVCGQQEERGELHVGHDQIFGRFGLLCRPRRRSQVGFCGGILKFLSLVAFENLQRVLKLIISLIKDIHKILLYFSTTQVVSRT